MSDVAIRAIDLTKVYRLYRKPAYRFLDIFGVLGDRPDAYTEHAALNGVSLEIRRGEKVAVIGRNGAGKSTFLKLVTNVIQPTSGRLDVVGDVHALLQIGTGFHPDFTGRQNVEAYLAQLGATGPDAVRRCADAIAFAELEEYIDQPVKTYSTGMTMRLMFSASTAITPDLLVLDEVLGVGDAYFAQKSYERMRELCDRNGATLLLVTHDIYSATRMCNRIIWLDRGRVAMDGDATTVVKAYAESIRAQEEHRLRIKQQAQLAATRPESADDSARLLLEIQASSAAPQPCPVYFSGISLVDARGTISELPLGDHAETAGPSQLVRNGSCWGEPTEWHGRPARPMLNYGSPFHKVAGVLALPERGSDDTSGLTLRLDYWSDESCELRLRGYRGRQSQDLGTLWTTAGAWSAHSIAYTPDAVGDVSTLDALLPTDAPFLQGSGAVVITGFDMIDAGGVPVHTVNHGDPIAFRIRYRIQKPSLRERVQLFIVISRNNIERVCKFMTDRLCFDASRSRSGAVELRLPKMMLGSGQYSVAVQIAAEGYIQQDSKKFFSLDPDVYHCILYATEFTVLDAGWIGDGTIFEGEGEWSMIADGAEQAAGQRA